MKKVLIPATLGGMAEGAASILAERGYDTIRLDDITPEDIDCGLAHVDNDVCFPTIAAVGQYMRYFEEHGAQEGICVLAAEMCRGCRSASAPHILPGIFKRAGLDAIEIVPFSAAESKSAAPSESPARIDSSKPVIGLCGNIPTLTTRELHRTVYDRLTSSGCQVVMPSLQRVANERDFLTPALEGFDELGISSVICILPFGCLGGHVYARGQLRKMQSRFPNIELTILDYDPSASEVNLENRAELVTQRAKEKANVAM